MLLLLTAFQDPPTATAPAAGGAVAEPTTVPTGPMDSLRTFIPILLVLGIFFFLLILPERKQRKKREAMLSALKKGDRVMTSGGLHGSVAMIQDDVVTLQVDEGVRLKFARSAIQTVLSDEAPAAAKK